MSDIYNIQVIYIKTLKAIRTFELHEHSKGLLDMVTTVAGGTGPTGWVIKKAHYYMRKKCQVDLLKNPYPKTRYNK